MLKGNFRMTEIPYRGSAPAINDLLAGNIDIVPDYLLANKQNIDAGKLKILAHRRPRAAQGLSQCRDLGGDAAGRLCRHLDGRGRASRHAAKEIVKKISDAIGQGVPDARSARARILALGGRAARQHVRSDARHRSRRARSNGARWCEAAKIAVE